MTRKRLLVLAGLIAFVIAAYTGVSQAWGVAIGATPTTSTEPIVAVDTPPLLPHTK